MNLDKLAKMNQEAKEDFDKAQEFIDEKNKNGLAGLSEAYAKMLKKMQDFLDEFRLIYFGDPSSPTPLGILFDVYKKPKPRNHYERMMKRINEKKERNRQKSAKKSLS